MKLPGDRTEPRKLLETLHVPKLLFNLVSALRSLNVVELYVYWRVGARLLILMIR